MENRVLTPSQKLGEKLDELQAPLGTLNDGVRQLSEQMKDSTALMDAVAAELGALQEVTQTANQRTEAFNRRLLWLTIVLVVFTVILALEGIGSLFRV